MMGRVSLELLQGKDPVDDDVLVVIIFPWAGGNLANPQLKEFAKHVAQRGGQKVVVYGVSLPGRLRTIGQEAFTDFRTLVPAVVEELKKHDRLKREYVFYGYSLGSLVAWQTLLQLEQEFVDRVKLFAAAACRSPESMAKQLIKVSEMTEEQFCEYLINKGGTPRELLAEKSIRDFVLPPIVADYKILESLGELNIAKLQGKLSCPLVAFHGDDIPGEEMESWKSCQREGATFHGVKFFEKGGHFFIMKNPMETAESLVDVIKL